MDHVIRGADWGGFAFWLFIAACVVAGAWEKIRKNAEKHETLRTIIQKTGTVDESRLKELFAVPAGSDWMKSDPGDGYRALRVSGFIVLGIGAGIAVVFFMLGQFGAVAREASIIGLSIAGGVAMFGGGLFLSSRFAERPPGHKDGSPDR